MERTDQQPAGTPVVENELVLSLAELCQACGTSETRVTTWVLEGVLEPEGDAPAQWRFSDALLRRARIASRLARDLELNPPAVALALDLLDEIAVLRARLRSYEFSD